MGRKKSEENVEPKESFTSFADKYMFDVPDVLIFKHKNIKHSCMLKIGNKSLEVNEGKVETNDPLVIERLRKDGWFELTKVKDNKPIKRKVTIEWIYKLANQKKYNGSICVSINNESKMLQVEDSLIKTDKEEVHKQLKKNGWILVSTKEEIL